MAVGLKTKLLWFDHAAAAFAQTFPKVTAARGPDAPPVYVCPLCIGRPDAEGRFHPALYYRIAVEARVLTAEHVPPGSFGGKELLLTCRNCNHTAGAKLDAHARRRENPIDAFAGTAKKPVPVRLTAGGHTIAATFRREGEMYQVKILPTKKGGKPGAEEGFRQVLSGPVDSDRDININFPADQYRARNADVSWLRSAYLVMFAILGYRYVFGPALELVRRQIEEPATEHISTFLHALPGDHPWSDRSITKVLEPEWQQCWLVKMGRYVVFLPKPGDLSLYERIAEARRQHVGEVSLRGETFSWPGRAFLGIAPR